MTPDKTCWNGQLIYSIFLPHEVQKIKALPLCVVPQTDYFYWSLEKSGIYSVKSGYKLLCEEERKDEASGSSRQGMFVLWSKIWSLKVPRKINHFLWRACTDCLPTKTNLLKRKIVADSLCQLWGKFPENTMHALWNCEVVRSVWIVEFSWVNEWQNMGHSWILWTYVWQNLVWASCLGPQHGSFGIIGTKSSRMIGLYHWAEWEKRQKT